MLDALLEHPAVGRRLAALHALELGLRLLQLSPRALCDLEVMAVGGFSPVPRFMNQLDYISVLERMRLADGTLFPIPITLPVADPAEWEGRRIALRSPSNHLIAVMDVEEVYEREAEMEAPLGGECPHPASRKYL